MSLGFYRVIKGQMVVRQRQSPDGDSMRFIPDDWALFEDLPRYREPQPNATGEASLQLRFQAIDTPETHYGGAKQPFGRAARDALLTWLGVDAAQWDWDVAPSGFAWETPAAIMTDGFDSHGRPIAFVFKDLDEVEDGVDVKLTNGLMAKTYNFKAVDSGMAYLGIYRGGLSFNLQNQLITAYDAARADKRGIWAFDRTSLFTVTNLDDISAENGQLVYPKVFRRCVDALKWASGAFEPGRDVDDFLEERPTENDKMLVRATHGGQVKSSLTDIIEQVNNQIAISIDLNTVEFVAK